MYAYVHYYHVHPMGGLAVMFIFRNVCDLILFFFEGGSFTRFAPRGTIETKNLLYRFAKYLTAPSGSGWFCLFIFYSCIYIYMCMYVCVCIYISKAQYCASREIAEVVDSFSTFFTNNRKIPRESQSEIAWRQHWLVCVWRV